MEAARFGPGALRLCALAARALGWRPEHFWQATPAELTAILNPPGEASSTLSRGDVTRMMEQDHG
ncbi:MAG: phage tail assembly chaperone [Novosphingobium sp.]